MQEHPWSHEGEEEDPDGGALEEGEGSQYEEDPAVIVIDNGSGVCKAGFSFEKAPRCSFPAIIGRPRQNWEEELGSRAFFGDDAVEQGNKLSISYPLENGIIENMADMELLWDYTFAEQLQVDPKDHPVLLTEPPYNPRKAREEMVQIMFESYGVPCLNISIQGVLALLGQGRTTGLVVDSGEGVTHTIPIFDGYCLPHCINRLDLAGRELNSLLAKLLAQGPPGEMGHGICLTTTIEQHCVRQMKEELCYVSMDPNTESEVAEQAIFKLPDGRQVKLKDERWKCPEALFNPVLVGLESQGVAGLVSDSINKCDIDIRKNLYANVCLSGGSTMFKGLSERLVKELRAFAPAASQAGVKVLSSKAPKDAVWLGGQVFSSLRHLQEDQWMTIEDYDEIGVSLIHEKLAVKCS